MADELTDRQLDWTAKFTGIDARPATPPASAPSARSAGQGEGDAGSSPSAGGGSAPPPAGADSAAPAPPAAGDAGPPPPIKLTHQTEARSPSNRARTRIGVGERVTLTVKPGPGKWLVSGAKLSSGTGSTVTLFAPGRAGKAAVSVNVDGQMAEAEFTIVAPSEVHQVATSTEHADNGQPNAGFHANIFVGPDDVNFLNITFTESEVGAKTSGYWGPKNGEGHSPNPSPLGFTSKVVSGKGTQAAASDHCWSGYVPGGTGPDWSGEATWSIPWHYQVGTASGNIATVDQRVVTASDGTTTISKAGASFTAKLSGP